MWHLDIRSPAVVVWLKAHPALKDLARARHVAQHLLHVHVLVPAQSQIGRMISAGRRRCDPAVLVGFGPGLVSAPDSQLPQERAAGLVRAQQAQGPVTDAALQSLPVTPVMQAKNDWPRLSRWLIDPHHCDTARRMQAQEDTYPQGVGGGVVHTRQDRHRITAR